MSFGFETEMLEFLGWREAQKLPGVTLAIYPQREFYEYADGLSFELRDGIVYDEEERPFLQGITALSACETLIFFIKDQGVLLRLQGGLREIELNGLPVCISATHLGLIIILSDGQCLFAHSGLIESLIKIPRGAVDACEDIIFSRTGQRYTFNPIDGSLYLVG